MGIGSEVAYRMMAVLRVTVCWITVFMAGNGLANADVGIAIFGISA